MSKHWREPLDPQKHRDFMKAGSMVRCDVPRDRLVVQWAYFVRECGFTFEFVSLDQLKICLAHFQRKLHPSSKAYNEGNEHWFHPWDQRLPRWLFEESKRVRIIAALQRAMSDFAVSGDEKRLRSGPKMSRPDFW